MDMQKALADCLVLNTVTAARTLVRRYDAKLKPHGVTIQQFSLLAAIRFHPGEPVAVLAQRILLDRTSLTRNLDLLEAKGLIRRVGTTGNARLCELSKKGDALLNRLFDEWRLAQAELMAGLEGDDATRYLEVSRQLAQG
ncbi:MAG: MarR family transcriptional regulator [Rhizobiaceae bacterium]|nr:MarR family transcriptional regulator [Rhizobiaceae bacterium]